MKRRTIWKKFLSGALALAMCGALTACGGNANNTQPPATEPAETNTAAPAEPQPADSDLAYVQSKGVLVVGITPFEPMDYQDADGNWIGFDADMAAAFAESIGVEANFQIIDWDNKVFELEGRAIDVVWNGMTLNDEDKAAMECSNPYFDNAQVVIVWADKAADYQTTESVADLSFAVEAGSAAKDQAEAHGFSYTEVTDQATALLEVSSGTADAAIIDFLMAKAMTGEGTSYADLTYTASLNTEQYGVGFRKGSDMAEALNSFFKQSYDENLMQQTAEKYNIAEALVAQ